MVALIAVYTADLLEWGTCNCGMKRQAIKSSTEMTRWVGRRHLWQEA